MIECRENERRKKKKKEGKLRRKKKEEGGRDGTHVGNVNDIYWKKWKEKSINVRMQCVKK